MTYHEYPSRDSLTGGLGNDTFVFDQALVAGNVATIVDFTHGGDVIALSHDIFTGAGPVGALSVDAFRIGAQAHDADARILYNPTTGGLLYDPDGQGGTAASTFATLSPGL